MKLGDIRRGGHAPSLVAAFLYFDISFMVWVILGALMPFIARDLKLTDSAKLTLVGTPLLAAGFWRILLGALADRYGSRSVGVVALISTVIPLTIAYVAGSTYQMLMAVALLLGIAGASFAVALPLASRWYPPHLQGVVMGIAGAGNSGTVLATLFAPLLAKAYGWQSVFGIMVVPVMLVLVAYTLLAKDPPRKAAPAALQHYLSAAVTADAWWFCLLYFVTFGGFVGLSSFINTYFVDQFGFDKAKVGLTTWPFIMAGSFLRPVGGLLADKLGGIRMLTLLYGAVALTALGVALVTKSFPLTCVALFLLMGLLGMGNGSVFQLVPQRFSDKIGAITGLVGAAGGVGGYYLNFALGHLKESTGTYGSGFIAFGILSLVALGVLKAVSARWVRDWLGAGGVVQAAKA